MILNKKLLFSFYRNKNISLTYFIDHLKNQKKINYYINDTRYLSISDSIRLSITKIFFKTKIVLIDIDGALNIKNDIHFYVRNINELKLNYLLIKKYKRILKNNQLICISNQAGISTGDLSYINLKRINKKIKEKLKEKNINIKEFFISPHHYNLNNFERKPNHGLFLKAAQKIM
jgi:histidinol phosphatase-like enzyme